MEGERNKSAPTFCTGCEWASLVAQELIVLSCNLFPCAKVGVAGMCFVKGGGH